MRQSAFKHKPGKSNISKGISRKFPQSADKASNNGQVSRWGHRVDAELTQSHAAICFFSLKRLLNTNLVDLLSASSTEISRQLSEGLQLNLQTLTIPQMMNRLECNICGLWLKCFNNNYWKLGAHIHISFRVNCINFYDAIFSYTVCFSDN